MKHLIFFAFLCFTLSSCTRAYFPHDSYGVDEFVTDSYKIREGKGAILRFEGHEVKELPEDALTEFKDSVQEEDILNIAIYHPTRKDLVNAIHQVNTTIGFKVTQGFVYIPDLQPIKVLNLTLEEARETIRSAFTLEIRDVDVFIDYKDRLSRKVDFIGQTNVPYLPVDGKIRLYEMLSKAIAGQKINFFKSYMLRNGLPVSVDFYRLMKLGDMSHNVVMKGKDKIYLAPHTDAKITITGEVLLPSNVPIPNGFMPLQEALVEARGIPFTGDHRFIQVIRGSLIHPKIYTLTWKHIVHLPNDSLLVMPGDTIYVATKPITEWNRFISQLLPSFTGLQAGYGASKTLGISN